MNQEELPTISELKAMVGKAYIDLDVDKMVLNSEELKAQMALKTFWDDPEQAAAISQKQASLEKRISFWKTLKQDVEDLEELDSLKDESLRSEIEQKLGELHKTFNEAKTQLLFNGEYDDYDVIMSIYAGAGGTDAQDWAEMLLRMYTRYAEKESLKATLIQSSSGDEAGIKSATLELSGGDYLFGKLQSENGVHRLVRLSPFNADSLRQTSFARVEIMPKISSPKDVEIDEKDLKIDVYRSGGKGGQGVNTTDSAVRITHVPTGIVVAIQNERSQLQNRETAMTILSSRLAQLKAEQHIERLEDLRGPNEQAAWGNQIRNYVMHPYTMVKDTRTKQETTDVQAVLDGDINQFIDAFLESHIS